MKLTLQIPDTNGRLTELPATPFNGCYEPDNALITVALPLGEAGIQAVTLRPGVLLVWGSYTVGQPTRLLCRGDEPAVGLHFVQAGEMTLHGPKTDARLNVAANRHTVWFDAGTEFSMTVGPPQPSRVLSVYLQPDVFGQLVGYPSLGVPEETDVAEPLSCRPITAAMQTVLEQITGCGLSGAVRRLFLEAKVMELLALQQEQLKASLATSPPAESHPDADRLQEARRLLEERFDNPPTLSELSRLVGMNEFKLKKEFKALYKETVYGWVLNYRLEHAYDLLKTGRYSVSEVAYTVGYQHPAHFTTAFRKKFGLAPREVDISGAQ
ncbi:helix-turn-helix domain-containing protein [Rudanella lutea]|uniref:helix-turn-helix domain-containing protein n=1 Tax=Rudanella lutea TaxID=451374 RepID=UPI00035E58C4|nr:AraC family transcriptional regulator [Rudanella lutea]